MQIGMIAGHTRILGRSQNYRGLPVKDEIVTDGASGQRVNQMTSVWELNPDELEMLKAGGKIYLSVFGTDHPPVLLNVGPAPAVDR